MTAKNEHPEHDAPFAPVDIGPGSLLWEYAGDWRMGTTGLTANILQLMHPAIGAGVEQHSDMFHNPWGRVFRSIPQILDVIYAPDGEAVGQRIRGYHSTIHGQDEHGRPYNALDPETFWWAHATFHNMTEQIIDDYDTRQLLPAEREQFYQETTTWFSRYGASMQPVPENRDAFGEKWDSICHDVLEMTPAAEWLVTKLESGDIERPSELPGLVWKLGGFSVKEFLRLTAIGGLPQILRQRFDLPWLPSDELKLSAIQTSTKHLWPLVPEKYRYHPKALAGIQRTRRTER